MKRTLILLLVFALPLAADDRAEKRRLLAEFFEVVDSKTLVQKTIDRVFAAMVDMQLDVEGELSEEERVQYAESRAAQQEQMRAFQARLYARIDYVKFADTVYTPVIDENFNAEELRALIAFAKTKQGQKFMHLIPELGLGVFTHGMKLMEEATEAAADELRKEVEAKQPWLRTMSDLRTLAVAVEARATDTEEFPKVSTLDELAPLITPTYLAEMPGPDSWGTHYLYVSDGKHYRFVSAGADKRFDWNARQLDPNAQPRAMESLDADIIFQDGVFIQYPKASRTEPESHQEPEQ